MKKVACELEIGYANAIRRDVFDVEDDVTEDEIEEMVQDWANNYIDIDWRIVE